MNALQRSFALVSVVGCMLAAAGCNDNGTGQNTWTIEGVTGPTVSYSTNRVVIYAVLKNAQVSAGVTMPIPNMPNSSIQVAPEVTGGLLLQASIDTNDVLALAGAGLLDPTTLPGGRPLPGVAGGTLPALAVQVPALNDVTFYIGSSVFGVFVPVSFGLDQLIGTFSFHDSSDQAVGNISVVGQDSAGENSGFLLMLNVDNIGSSMAQKKLLKL